MPEKGKSEFSDSRSAIEAEIVLVERNMRSLEERVQESVIASAREIDKLKKLDIEAELKQRMADWYRAKAQADELRKRLDELGS